MRNPNKKAPNSPSVVRRSFLAYLRTEFPHLESWRHPVSDETFPHETIKRCLLNYKQADPQGYDLLWYLWQTPTPRSVIADALNYSPPTVKRRWDRSVDTIMGMLLFPELSPSVFSPPSIL